MHQTLQKQLAKFQSQATSVPLVNIRTVQSAAPQPSAKPTAGVKRPFAPAPPPDDTSHGLTARSLSARSETVSQNRFSLLAAIVTYLRERHAKGETHALSLDELLEELKLTTVNRGLKVWLTEQVGLQL